MVAGDKFSVAVYPLSVNTTNHTSNNLSLFTSAHLNESKRQRLSWLVPFLFFKIVKGSNTISLLICRVAWYENYHQ